MVTAVISVAHVTCKNKDTWCEILRHCRCQIRFILREYSWGGVLDDISCNFDGNPNLLNANRNDDDSWLNTYYDNPDNRWNRDNGFAFAGVQLSLFLLYFW